MGAAVCKFRLPSGGGISKDTRGRGDDGLATARTYGEATVRERFNRKSRTYEFITQAKIPGLKDVIFRGVKHRMEIAAIQEEMEGAEDAGAGLSIDGVSGSELRPVRPRQKTGPVDSSIGVFPQWMTLIEKC